MWSANTIESLKKYLQENNITNGIDDSFKYDVHYGLLFLQFLCERLLTGDPNVTKEVKFSAKDFAVKYDTLVKELLDKAERNLQDGMSCTTILAAVSNNITPTDREIDHIERSVTWHLSDEIRSFLLKSSQKYPFVNVKLSGYGICTEFNLYKVDNTFFAIGNDILNENQKARANSLPITKIELVTVEADFLPYKWNDGYKETLMLNPFDFREAQYLMRRGQEGLIPSIRHRYYRMSTLVRTLMQNQVAYLVNCAFKDEYNKLSTKLYSDEVLKSTIINHIGNFNKFFNNIFTNAVEYLSRGCKRYWEDDVKAAKIEQYTITATSTIKGQLKHWIKGIDDII